MRKPFIKNWIKYWASALAVSGMLVVGGCGNSGEEAEVADELEAPATEVVETDADDRQTVGDEVDVDYVAEEEVEIETVSADPGSDDFPATYINDMDAFIQEHEKVNTQIRKALIDNNTELDAGSTPAMYEEEQPLTNTDQTEMVEYEEQDTTVYDPQSNIIEEDPDGYWIILEEYRVEYEPEVQEAMDRIVEEYNTRRENMRGQMDETTGAYASPEVDPKYQEGIKQLMENIQQNLVYPQNAAAAELEGTVFVNFIVDENGNITEANVVEDIFVPITSMEFTQPLNPTKFSEEEIEEAKEEMKKEAIKAVKATSGQWEPAQQDGMNVKAEVQLPVVFDMENIAAPEDVPLEE